MRRQVAAVAVVGLVIAGCGGSDDLADRFSDPDSPISGDELDEMVERMAEQFGDLDDLDAPDQPGPGATEPDPGGAGGQTGTGDLPPLDPADFPTIDDRTIDAAVLYGAVEWEVQEMLVVDLDADIQPGDIPQGLEITFPTRAYNAGSSTASVNGVPMALQWEDAATGDTVTVRVQPDFRDVPGESFGTGELTAQLSADERVIFDPDSAYLLVGREGVSPAVVPIGSDVELVDRFPVSQDTTGWEIFIEGVDTARRQIDDRIEVTAAEVRWSGPTGQPLEDGSVLLQIAYTIENRGEGQTCSARSSGGWRLTLPNGDAVNDEGVSERCAGAGDTVTGVFSGFIFPTDDFAGDYVLTHNRGSGATNPGGEVAITLVEGEGVRLSELD